MNYKILRMHWSTWKNLRHKFPGEPNETMDAYCQRIVRRLKNGRI